MPSGRTKLKIQWDPLTEGFIYTVVIHFLPFTSIVKHHIQKIYTVVWKIFIGELKNKTALWTSLQPSIMNLFVKNCYCIVNKAFVVASVDAWFSDISFYSFRKIFTFKKEIMPTANEAFMHENSWQLLQQKRQKDFACLRIHMNTQNHIQTLYV